MKLENATKYNSTRDRSIHTSERSRSRSSRSSIDPNLPLEDIVRDLYSSNPPHETCATIDHTDHTARTRQHELDHTWYKSSNLSVLKDLAHEVEIEDLSGMWKVLISDGA